MKKSFNFYIILWALLVAIFTVISFASISWAGDEIYNDSFWLGHWIAYVFVIVMFAGQAICTYIALKDDNAKKVFLNIPLIKTSYAGLITSFIIGIVCVSIPPIPFWVCIILCAIVLVSNILSLIKAGTVISEVARIDDKVKTQTFFIKSLTVDADTLMASAKSEAVKAECRKVYEAVRYSDPMSHDALSSVESSITIEFAKLTEAVKEDNAERVAELVNEVVILVGERNEKCKLLR